MASPLSADPTRARDSSVVIVLTTLPAGADAAAFARTLVEERLAACVSVGGEMQSVYRWKDTVEQDREHQVVMKTVRGMVGPLRTRLATLHPYEVPEFLVIPADDGSDAYLEWVRWCTGA
jgi:periplasmic divalent cation tolerance protein